MAVIVAPGVDASPATPSAEQLLSVLRGRLTLSDVADSPQDARYAVSSVDAANMPLLQGVTPVAGLPWPSSAGVTQFNGRTGNVTVNQLSGTGPTYGVGVSTAGSGVRIGDQRNLHPVTAVNYQSGWSGANITYTSTPTTATIDVSAATLYYGNNSLNYSASSVPVTGTANTTVTFYLYYNDPTYAGGTQTLYATTNPHGVVTSEDYVNIGQIAVTFPATGTGGGSGTGGCVSVDAWVIKRGPFGVRRRIRAGRVKVGDLLWLVGGRWGRVTFSETVQQSCRRIETVRGTLACSASAPLRLIDGSVKDAINIEPGDWLQVHDGQARVTANRILGMGPVQRLTVENAFFWCRSSGSVWFAHHNMKPP